MPDNSFLENITPKITVFGVGGAGGNAVNNMIRSNLEGVSFIAANTDAQSLRDSLADTKVQLGLDLTQGLGAGSKPDVGRASAEEVLEEIERHIKGNHMIFITAGMGGGTGTGAAPIIARTAREMGILTVGVVTKPFHFEGSQRMKTAEAGIEGLQQHVDTLIVIPNQNLFRLATEQTTFADAFNMADNVLYSGVRGVTDLMIMPGLINLDFADVKSVMSEMGKAMMGTGEAQGENRAIEAAEAAISNPLLDDVSMRGAKGVLINITGGMDMTLFEVDEAANRIREEVDAEANIIFGSTFDDRMNGTMRVSVVATGIDAATAMKARARTQPQSTIGQNFNPHPSLHPGKIHIPSDPEPELDLKPQEEYRAALPTEHQTSSAEKDSQSPQRASFDFHENPDEGPTRKNVSFEEKNPEMTKEQAAPQKNISVPEDQPTLGTRSGKPPSFLEKLGFGKQKKEAPTVNSPKEQGAQSYTPKPAQTFENTGMNEEIQESPHPKQPEKKDAEDLLDIPAFLRRKK